MFDGLKKREQRAVLKEYDVDSVDELEEAEFEDFIESMEDI